MPAVGRPWPSEDNVDDGDDGGGGGGPGAQGQSRAARDRASVPASPCSLTVSP